MTVRAHKTDLATEEHFRLTYYVPAGHFTLGAGALREIEQEPGSMDPGGPAGIGALGFLSPAIIS